MALSDEERELNPDAAEATGSAVAPVRHLAPPCQIPSPAQCGRSQARADVGAGVIPGRCGEATRAARGALMRASPTLSGPARTSPSPSPAGPEPFDT
jgi:hypothetical protein